MSLLLLPSKEPERVKSGPPTYIQDILDIFTKTTLDFTKPQAYTQPHTTSKMSRSPPYFVTRVSSNEIRFGPVTTKKSAQYFLDLPSDIKKEIFDHLPYSTLVNLRVTHSKFTSVAQEVIDERPVDSNGNTIFARRCQRELSMTFDWSKGVCSDRKHYCLRLQQGVVIRNKTGWICYTCLMRDEDIDDSTESLSLTFEISDTQQHCSVETVIEQYSDCFCQRSGLGY